MNRAFPAWRVAIACLVALSCATAAGAAPRWLELKSANFLLAGDVTERDLRDVARRFEEFRETLSRLLPKARFAAVPTVVLVFPNERTYEPFRPLYNGKPIEVSGFFQPGPDVNYVTMLLDARADPYPIVFHEFTHLFISANLGNVPVWFGEGLAEYYSSFESDGKTARVGRVVQRHVLLLRERWVPLDQVLAATHQSPLYNDSRDRGLFYAESWALMHYLLVGAPARMPQLFTFLRRLDAGTPREQACLEAFGVSTAALDKEVRSYVQRMAFSWQLVTFDTPIAARVSAPARTLIDADVEARFGDLLLHMNRQADAEARLQNALRLDPKSLPAHLALGEMRLRQNKTSDGLALLERAVALHPEALAAHLTYGRAVLRRTGGLPTPNQVETARAAYTRALEIAPDAPEALAGLGWALLAANERLDDARRFAERAIALEPSELDHALLLAQVLARQQDFKGARALLGPLMASTQPNIRERARSMAAVLASAENRAAARRAAAQAETPGADAGQPASTPTPPAVTAARSTYRLDLRPVRDGEQRAFGSLDRVECADAGFVFHVKIDDRILLLTAAKMEAVDFISYRDDLKGSVACGERQPPDPVYATWRKIAPDGAAVKAGTLGKRAATVVRADGEAVAMEFVPRDYVPKREK